MKTLMIVVVVLLLATGVVFAQMGGGHMSGGHMGGGMGYGIGGAGGMVSGMMGNTISHGYLDILNPLDTLNEAREAIQAFIDSSNSELQISELWEYATSYKAELSDTYGAKAFDLIADKFTGVVMPEMSLSMMMNASYGRSLYRMPAFGKNLNLTLNQAKQIAEDFIKNNSLPYTIGVSETYPGYYKFHTTDSTGKFGMDIMVNGYNGGVWMDTLLGVPIAKY